MSTDSWVINLLITILGGAIAGIIGLATALEIQVKEGCEEWLNKIERFVEKLRSEFGGILRLELCDEEKG